MKPRSATAPFFWTEPVILDAQMGKELEGNSVKDVLVIKTPWPESIVMTVYQDYNTYLDRAYIKLYSAPFCTGDRAMGNKHGYV